MNKVAAAVMVVSLIGVGAWIAGRQTPSEPASGYSIMITDDLGRVVTISGIPERIVSLAPSNTEILFALGLENQVVGVTNYCDYPPEAREKENVGGFSTPSVEKIVALAPDLVLATGIHKDIISQQMEGLGLTIVAINPENVERVLDSIQLAGKATGRIEAAEALISNMRQRIDNITNRTRDLLDNQKPKVFYVSWLDPLKTLGPGTYGNDLIRLAGGVNIAADATTKYPIYSMEVLVERNPGVIIVSTSHGGGGPTIDGVKTLLAGKNIAAVEDNRVYSIDIGLTGRGGPRIVDGLETMAGYLHPELFG